MDSKVLSMYLPQFYRTKENDEWWGDGFTEWTTVKGAKSLFENHMQPVEPMNDRYYDLLDKNTMKWQIELMKKYGIDGMCIYHYWFKDGRQVLEKPAENLLKWNDLNIEYCFCWANETWTRTWSNYGDSNVWAAKYEKNISYDNYGILLEQQYGNEDAWKKHFYYLLDFFLDKRYLKYENKPVFVIYRPHLIFCLQEMVDVWNQLARKNGFDGVYFILANCTASERKICNLELIHEPQNTFLRSNVSCINEKNVKKTFIYDDVVEASLNYISKNNNVTYGGFIDYDDTPRRGVKGAVILEKTPEKFELYIKKLIAKNEAVNSPFVFINAWNEWGEGMHFEPEKIYGYKYLEAFSKAKTYYLEWIDYFKTKIETTSEFGLEEKELSKYENYTNLLHNWLLKKEMGRSFSEYLKSFKYQNVAIYGMGIMGKHLVAELINTDINIVYAIDNDDVCSNANIPVYKIEQVGNDVDVIIVTVTYAFEIIKEQLSKYTSTKIISLEQIVMEC